MRIRLAAGLAVLVAFASVASAADPVKVKSPWDFGVGSFVHMKMTTKMSMPGAPAMPDQVSETKQTLVKITDEAWIVKTETKMGETWMTGTEFPWPRKVNPGEVTKDVKVETEELGTEKVTVEGTAYECKKVRMKGAFGTTTTWVNEKLGALKTETETPGTGTTTMVVTALAKKAKAGDKEVVCREQKSTSKTTMGPITSETTQVILTSDSVPGHTVRMEMTMSGQMTMSQVSEIIAFEAK
jgi:hypothetical protein